jgi:hypothetical protein
MSAMLLVSQVALRNLLESVQTAVSGLVLLAIMAAASRMANQ